MVHLKITHSKRISPYPPHFILHSFASIPAIYLHSGFCCLAGCLNFSLPTANHLSNPHHRNSSSSPKMWAPAYRKPIREKTTLPPDIRRIIHLRQSIRKASSDLYEPVNTFFVVGWTLFFSSFEDHMGFSTAESLPPGFGEGVRFC